MWKKQILNGVAALALLLGVLGLPAPVKADGAPSLEIFKVNPGVSVTIHSHNFPANQLFDVSFEVDGKQGREVIDQTNSGGGGSFEETYNIPQRMKNEARLIIRLASSQGVAVSASFQNAAQGVVVPVTGGASGPELKVLGAESDKRVYVEAGGFSANTTLRVRMGPFKTFSREQVQVMEVITDKDGRARFTAILPDLVIGKDQITIRVDGTNKQYAFNMFKNQTFGSMGGSIPVTGGSTSSNVCQITETAPSISVAPKAEFDGAWTVKNISDKTWDAGSVDYKFDSGSKLYKYADRYDLNQTVKSGESVRVIVDMVAPEARGSYTTTWILLNGTTPLCTLPLTVVVR